MISRNPSSTKTWSTVFQAFHGDIVNSRKAAVFLCCVCVCVGGGSSVGRALDSFGKGPEFFFRCGRPLPTGLVGLRLRQKSWSPSSVSCVAAHKIVRR